jgi:hypothetical protein
MLNRLWEKCETRTKDNTLTIQGGVSEIPKMTGHGTVFRHAIIPTVLVQSARLTP